MNTNEKQALKERTILFDEFVKQMDNFYNRNVLSNFNSRYLKKLNQITGTNEDTNKTYSGISFCYLNDVYSFLEIERNVTDDETILYIEVNHDNPSIDLLSLNNYIIERGFETKYTKLYPTIAKFDVDRLEVYNITKQNIKYIASYIQKFVIPTNNQTDVVVDKLNKELKFFEIVKIQTRGKNPDYFIISKDPCDTFYKKMYGLIPGNIIFGKKMVDELTKIKKYVKFELPTYQITRDGMEDIFESEGYAFIGHLTNI